MFHNTRLLVVKHPTAHSHPQILLRWQSPGTGNCPHLCAVARTRIRLHVCEQTITVLKGTFEFLPPHLKDGESNLFNLFVSPHLGGTPSSSHNTSNHWSKSFPKRYSSDWFHIPSQGYPSPSHWVLQSWGYLSLSTSVLLSWGVPPARTGSCTNQPLQDVYPSLDRMGYSPLKTVGWVFAMGQAVWFFHSCRRAFLLLMARRATYTFWKIEGTVPIHVSHVQLPYTVINMQDGGGGYSELWKTWKVWKTSNFIKVVGSISSHIGSHKWQPSWIIKDGCHLIYGIWYQMQIWSMWGV